jgi:tetrahydromethanopterin S-methyltransferase subunit G
MPENLPAVEDIKKVEKRLENIDQKKSLEKNAISLPKSNE